MTDALFYAEVGPRGRAIVKHRRRPSENDLGPPYGYADLPGSVGATLVLSGGVLGDAAFRASNGTITVEQGVRGGSPYSIERATRWDFDHPRDRAAVEALRSLSGPWEVGWRAATS